MATIEINVRATCKFVDGHGAQFAIAGDTKRVSWDELRAAASQDDPVFAAYYTQLLNMAHERAARFSPIVVTHGRDKTNVMFVTAREYLWTGHWDRGSEFRAADEGMSLPKAWMAEQEAQTIAERIRKTGREVIVRAA
jgi:hypothetical protein